MSSGASVSAWRAAGYLCPALCGPTCLPFSIVLSGVTGDAARHGARFRKASRTARFSLSFSFCYPAILLSRSLCPATSTEHREVRGVVFFFFPSPLCHHPPYTPTTTGILSLPSPFLSAISPPLPPRSRSVVGFFFFLLFPPLSFASFFFCLFFEWTLARAPAGAQRGQLDGLRRW